MNKDNQLLKRLKARIEERKLQGGVKQYEHGGSHEVEYNTMDKVQDALTVGGLTPGVGIIPDAINTGISAIRSGYNYLTGDTDRAKSQMGDLALNAASMIPIAGHAAGATKLAKTTQKVLKPALKVKKGKSAYNLGEAAVDSIPKGTVTPIKPIVPITMLSNPAKPKTITPGAGTVLRPNVAQQGGWMKRMGGVDSPYQYGYGGSPSNPEENTLNRLNARKSAAQLKAEQQRRKKYYMSGGEMNEMGEMGDEQELPGGVATPIPGSDAIEFSGQTHDEGGIQIDPMTEVEDGETMDQVTVAKKGGQRKDYFFSSYLKEGGRSYADMHKELLENGGDQDDIDWLAQMQEKAAGRDPKQIGRTGGKRMYNTGGMDGDADGNGIPDVLEEGGQEETTQAQQSILDSNPGSYLRNGTVYNSKGEAIFADIDGNDINDYDEGVSSYHNVQNDNVRATKEADVANAIKLVEDATNSTFNPKSGRFETEDGTEVDNKTVKKAADDNNVNVSTANTGGGDGNKESSDNKYPVASDVYWSEYGDVPNYQPSVTIGDGQYYLDDAELQEYMTNHEDFGGEWMGNVDPEVLENAGITDYTQLTSGDKEAITRYQEAWNAKYPNNKITVDGKFGEQTIRTGYKPPEDEGGDKTEIIEDDETTTTTTTETDTSKRKTDWMTTMAQGVQLIPAMVAMRDKPDYMEDPDLIAPGIVKAERVGKMRLDRVDYNDMLSRNSSDARAMGRFIETSGGGPANIVNKMAVYAKKQAGDLKVKAEEERANNAIRSQEAAINNQRDLANVTNALNASTSNANRFQDAEARNAHNKMTVDEFNRGADAATKDRKLAALDSMAKTIAGVNRDRLAYNAQERMAKAISGRTGVYDRERGIWISDLDNANSDIITEETQTTKSTKKKNTVNNTTAKRGGYYQKMKRYGK